MRNGSFSTKYSYIMKYLVAHYLQLIDAKIKMTKLSLRLVLRDYFLNIRWN